MQAVRLAPAGSVAKRFQPRPLPYPASLSMLLPRSDFTLDAEGIPLQGVLTAPAGHDPSALATLPLTTLRWSLGGVAGDLTLPEWVAARLLRAVEPDPREEIDGTTAALLLEMALAEPLGRLEAACGEPVKLLEYGHPAALPASPGRGNALLGIAGLFDGEPFAGAVRAPEEALAALGRLAAFLPASAGLIEPPVVVAVRLGLARLGATLLRSLEVGDAVVLEQPPQGGIVIVAGESLAAPGRLDGSRAILEARLQRASATGMETWVMSENAERGVSGAEGVAPLDASLQDMQVTLVFELARQAASLRDVQSLAPGHIIELGPLAEQHVSILANGARIGEGEIVRVGDVTAVRLTRLAAA